MRVATGNGLRPQIWEEFQSRFGIKQIGEFYGSTEGTASIINIDSTPGSCGFVSEIAPAAYPVVIFKVDPDTGELVRGADGLAVRTKPGEVGQIVGKSIKGSFFLLIFLFLCYMQNPSHVSTAFSMLLSWWGSILQGGWGFRQTTNWSLKLTCWLFSTPCLRVGCIIWQRVPGSDLFHY